jgi:hypothetical protein
VGHQDAAARHQAVAGRTGHADVVIVLLHDGFDRLKHGFEGEQFQDPDA